MINKITKLNSGIYEEIKIKEIKIQSDQNLTGMHTITIAKNGFYFDYRSEGFIFAFILKLSAYIRKKIVKLFHPRLNDQIEISFLIYCCLASLIMFNF